MEEHACKIGTYCWTEDKCIDLIRKFRDNTILWDTKCPMFYKQHIKKKVWDNIGRVLNTTGAECKHKMSILLSSFRREKSKLRNSLARNGSPFQSTWFAFNELSFLLQRHSQEIPLRNHDDSGADAAFNESDLNISETYYIPEENSIDLNLKTEQTSDDDEALERDLGVVTTIIENSTCNRRVEDPIRNPTPERAQQIPIQYEQSFVRKTAVTYNDPHIQEEISTFAAFMAAKMKKYSPETLNVVQKEICDILFKADKNIYDSTSSDGSQSNSKKRKLTED
ncbi:uncharacterized protein LOC121725712 [Aricia agestis]|uniref:uncharacterized protein LOC121725712 n=1 Tax=Aricia agestis TaxID=91739 RepID=UPI001C20A25E|nr:uncharacterized protein LOC121725712 [Aricia agestis]